MSKQLQELGEWKVGQEVIVIGGGFTQTKRVAKIDKITDGWGGTLSVQGDKYDARGWQRGGEWDGKQIVPSTEELKREIHGMRARNKLQHFAWHSLDPSEALRIYGILASSNVKI